MAKQHPDFLQEAEHLSYVKDYIKLTLRKIDHYLYKCKGDMKEAFQQIDWQDSSSGYMNMVINAKFMDMAEKSFINLSKVKEKPYFARIDFKAEGNEKVEEIYIGKAHLSRQEDNKQLIIDWRAPVASVYYEGKLGQTSYPTIDGEETGELLLKRQYMIEDGELQDILDIDIAANDPLLQNSLKSNADKKLKDIASTIQSEQNRVIRADMHVPLIVQGVAGSGKTTIALHRIAYFIYTYEKTFDPDNFMIIAPNKMFINYISEVLPELGVEAVKQTTFIEFMESLLGKKYKLVDTSKKLMQLIDQGQTDEANIIWASRFKGSMSYKEIIDNYIKDIEAEYIKAEDFILDGNILIPKEEIKNYLQYEYNYLPLYKRVGQLKKVLKNKLKRTKVLYLEEVEKYYEDKINKIRIKYKEPLERQKVIVTVMDERDERLVSIKKELKEAVNKYLKKFKTLDAYEVYRELITNKALLNKYSPELLEIEKLEHFCNHNLGLAYTKSIELEDYAALVYLKYRLYGFKERITIQSVVIDEAQDFSVFQFYVIKEVLNTEKITLLGDISQGIHSYRGINSWNEVIEQVFTTRKATYISLVQSYRTTIEIMELANKVIGKLQNPEIVMAKPVIRHGDKPTISYYEDKKKVLEELAAKLLTLHGKYKSVAVICKTKKEAETLKNYLTKKLTFKINSLDERQDKYEAGVVILPSHLAKGLEFDAVLVVNLEEKYTKNELDIKLLYVAMTRALHELHIVAKKRSIFEL